MDSPAGAPSTPSRNVLDPDGYVIRVFDLYHRTSRTSADTILSEGTFVSRCQSPSDAYFSNRADGQAARHYGDVVLRVEVPTSDAIVDDQFRDGEVFYRVPLSVLAGVRVAEVR